MIKKSIIILATLISVWEVIVVIFKLPIYILPTPLNVIQSLCENAILILDHTLITLLETGLGFILSCLLGISSALILAYFRPARLWFLPLLLITQALPTFAMAPLFILWLGYGISSKIALTMVMLFFPITSNFYDGLLRTPTLYLDVAQTIGATRWKILRHVQVPAALPALASGLRIAATFAPLGAIMGEWVGASQGLGFLMMNANARMEISLMFAILVVVIIVTLLFYFLIDRILKKYIWWKI